MKRRAIQIIVFLLLGAIVNVAVAWGCALVNWNIPANELDGSAVTPYGLWQVTTFSRFGEIAVLSQWMKDDDPPTIVAEHDPRDVLPICFLFLEPSVEFIEATMPVVEVRLVVARGLPFGSLWSERAAVLAVDEYDTFRRRNIVPELTGGIEMPLSWPTNGTGSWPRDLPFLLLWPGFAINTIFYAAVLWVIFFAPFALRRRLRIRRGLCPVCAYPIGSSPVCTECGKAVTIRGVEPT